MVDVEDVFVDYFVYKSFISPKYLDGKLDDFWGIGEQIDLDQMSATNSSGDTLTTQNILDAVERL